MPAKTRRSPAVADRFKSEKWKALIAECQVCEWRPPVMLGSVRETRLFTMLHAHHVVPIAAGGKDHAKNLVLLCPNHHAIAHALGKIVADKGAKGSRKLWTGPTTPEALLNEIRWVENDMDRWLAHVRGGRDHMETAALERRSLMTVTRGAAA